MLKSFSVSFCLVIGSLSIANAQFGKNFGIYVGYSLINEPNLTLEYRFHPRLAVNLEGAAFVPFKKVQYVGGIGSEIGYRINGQGGAIRVGMAVYGKRHFGVMHRVMVDITYFSSNLYQERFGVQTAVEDRFYREFMQYAVFYEPTFRLGRNKRHHLFARVGAGVRGVYTHTVYSDPPGVVKDNWTFRSAMAPVLSLGYRIRLTPQKGYFTRQSE